MKNWNYNSSISNMAQMTKKMTANVAFQKLHDYHADVLKFDTGERGDDVTIHNDEIRRQMELLNQTAKETSPHIEAKAISGK